MIRLGFLYGMPSFVSVLMLLTIAPEESSCVVIIKRMTFTFSKYSLSKKHVRRTVEWMYK